MAAGLSDPTFLCSGLTVSVVIPVFNNSEILDSNIRKLTIFLSKEFADYELILVDDKSTDRSADMLRAAASQNAKIRVLWHHTNRGQQWAIANGALMARENTVIVIDADLPCLLSDLKKIALLTAAGTELVLCRRAGALSRPWFRRAGSLLASKLCRLLFRYGISDFGCSTGAVRRELIERVRVRASDLKLLKIQLLQHANSFVETEITVPPVAQGASSAYSFAKLVSILWSIAKYRIFG
jgi:undecaprenyl-phosphate 4-deoxy-4-formamido-L-arabinose transferase